MWFSSIFSGRAKPRGFSEGPQARALLPPDDVLLAAAPFPSTGPVGHRATMREIIPERGPDALADYELLEMLLFFAIKKGDTKPLAKALINRYESYASVLAASQRELLETRGLGPRSVAALKLVQASALRMVRAEVMDQPVLNNWDRLMVRVVPENWTGGSERHPPLKRPVGRG